MKNENTKQKTKMSKTDTKQTAKSTTKKTASGAASADATAPLETSAVLEAQSDSGHIEETAPAAKVAPNNIYGVLRGETEINPMGLEGVVAELQTKHSDQTIDLFMQGTGKAILQTDLAFYSLDKSKLEKFLADRQPGRTEEIEAAETAAAPAIDDGAVIEGEEGIATAPAEPHFEADETSQVPDNETQVYLDILEMNASTDDFMNGLFQKEQKLIDQFAKSKKFPNALSGPDQTLWETVKEKFNEFRNGGAPAEAAIEPDAPAPAEVGGDGQEPIENFQKHTKLFTADDLTEAQRVSLSAFEQSDTFHNLSKNPKIDGITFHNDGTISVFVWKTKTQGSEFFITPDGALHNWQEVYPAETTFGERQTRDAAFNYEEYKAMNQIVAASQPIDALPDLPPEPLSDEERKTFSEQKEIVKEAKAAFDNAPRIMMTALSIIREGKLYRESHSSFEKFVDEEFGITRQYAHNLAQFGDMLKVIGDGSEEFKSVRAIQEMTVDVNKIAESLGVDKSDFETMAPIVKAVAQIVVDVSPRDNGGHLNISARTIQAVTEVVESAVKDGTVEIDGVQMRVEEAKQKGILGLAVKSEVVHKVAENLLSNRQTIIDESRASAARRTAPHEAAPAPTKKNGKDIYTGEVPKYVIHCTSEGHDQAIGNEIVAVFNAGFELACGCKYQKLTTSGDAFVCIETEGQIVNHA